MAAIEAHELTWLKTHNAYVCHCAWRHLTLS